MNGDKINRWLSLGANVGVIAGLIFVAMEIQTNTESNIIAVEANYANNWMTVNNTIASNAVFAAILEKGLAGEQLTKVETRQLRNLTYMYLTQSFHMLRLYDIGLISEGEVRDAFRAVRKFAEQGRVREIIQNDVTYDRGRRMIVDPDGLDRWLNAQP